MHVKDKVALVTGATSGVGRATAEVFARQGAHVVATGRRAELGKHLESEVREAGHEITFLQADVSRVADCQLSVETAVATYGRIDVVVNAAGIESSVTDFHTLTEDEWDTVLDINLKGTAFCCQAAVPHMLEQGGGVLLNIASINAVEALAHMAPYNVSKAGVVQLTRTLAVEYLLQGIRANAILLGGAEGGTATRSQDGFARYMRGPDFTRSTEEPDALARLMIQPAEDVGKVLALLCSDDARLLTGATIALDRAMTAGFTTSMVTHMTTAELWT
jgi:NAD(P)-dependent dehydrogenase (short-subunit alcohol dehydrogenase family)